MYAWRSLRWLFHLFVVAGVVLSTTYAETPAEAREQDIAQMKRVWEALMSYKKAKGRLPDTLSELVPEFLNEPKLLVSPIDDGELANGPLTKKEAKFPSSYGYEWGPQKFGELTFTEVKTCQVEEYGPVVPLLRCFLHSPVLNLAHDGTFYETDTNWEVSPAVQAIIKKNGLGPGASKGLFLDLTTTDSAGKPLANVSVQIKGRYIENVWLPEREITTDAEGRVRVPFGPTKERTATLFFAKEGYFAFPRSEDNFEAKLAVTLLASQRVGGVIQDSHGKPLPGAKVFIKRGAPERMEAGEPVYPGGVHPEGDLDAVELVESGPDGKWSMERFPRGETMKLIFAVSHPGHAFHWEHFESSEVDARGYTTGSAVTKLQPTITVEGTLHDVDGAPRAGATVFMHPPRDPLRLEDQVPLAELKTDLAGNFTFSLRIPGDVALGALMQGRTPLTHVRFVSAKPEPIKLQHGAGRRIQGKVVTDLDQPVAGVPVLFYGTDGMLFPEQAVIATTDAEGRWHWDHAPPKHVVVSVLLPSGVLRHERENVLHQPIHTSVRTVDLY